MSVENTISIPPEMAGQTLAACVKRLAGERSWSEVKKLIAQRHVKVNRTLCVDETRRLKGGDQITVTDRAAAPVPRQSAVEIVYLDEHLVIVEKPPGIQTVRRHEEMHFSIEKKRLQPTLDEVVGVLLAGMRRGAGGASRGKEGPSLRTVRAVHRLDRDTSGLMLFALSAAAESALVKMFAAHAVQRIYTAVVHGRIVKGGTVDTLLGRDRGDGLRGSLPRGGTADVLNESAQQAITHLKPVKALHDDRGNEYTLIECRLETGRTHQIRIHLSELGHRICGESVYTRPEPGGPALADASGAPRQALHSCELQLSHPITGKLLRFKSPMPKDLANWLSGLR